MEEITVIFPHQLFEENPAIDIRRIVYLLEEQLFFKQYRFHKQKLAFHRATMKSYEIFLQKKGFTVEYVDFDRPEADIREFIQGLQADAVHMIDPVDNYLHRRVAESCKKVNIELVQYASPGFINTGEELSAFFTPTKKKFLQTEFYIGQRKKSNIMLDATGSPLGGKWTFDTENRKKYPRGKTPPGIDYPSTNSVYDEAIAYIELHFPANPGALSTPLYPVDFEMSKRWLDQFLATRFSEFGDYEDAIVANERILNHSVLSPLINAGLLTPDFVVKKIVTYAAEHKIALNNTEGLIRQLIGWREFIRGMYEIKGSKQRTTNFWGFKRKIPASFYDGTTGIAPVDATIKKLLSTGYNHHIERLMILGNFMLLCEFDPDEVYRWFMEMYIDAYDWVMVPNVYGMSQFADGGLMASKPYISGSNYLRKMSDYEKGEWQEIWDGLFWRFMDTHRTFFLRNPRLGMLVRTWDRMSAEKQQSHLKVAEEYLAEIR